MVGLAKKTIFSSNIPKIRAVSNKHLVKELKPSSVDAKYFGPEPNYAEIQPDDDIRQRHLGEAFNWYSRFYGGKEAKEFIIGYLASNGKTDVAKTVKKAPDAKVIPTFGWVARLALRGLVLNEQETDYLNGEVNRLLLLVNELQGEDAAEEDSSEAPNRPNIQDIMKEKTLEASGELEGLMDQFTSSGYPKEFTTKDFIFPLLQERKILPQHVNILVKVWEEHKAEYTEVQTGQCEQIVESYSNLTKMQIRNAIKFIDSVIADLHGYAAIKQANKKPRARKAVPVERVVAKLKYCRSFTDTALGIDLKSVSPTKLHNCSEAWCYDTKKRKIHHYVADEYGKILTVKGNTLIGFDKVASGIKALRKPAEQLKEIVGSKPAARKFFKDIKAVQSIPTGRFNADMIILKAW